MRRKNVNNEFIKTCLSDALFYLLKDNDYSVITVNEICNKAGIGRTTYYRHFNNKDGKEQLVRHKITTDIVEYYRSHKKESEEDFDFVLLKQVYDNRKTYKLIKQNNLLSLLYDIFYEIFNTYNKTSEGMNEYLKDFFVGGIYGIIYHWILTDFRDTPKELHDQFVMALYYKIMSGFDKSSPN